MTKQRVQQLTDIMARVLYWQDSGEPDWSMLDYASTDHEYSALPEPIVSRYQNDAKYHAQVQRAVAMVLELDRSVSEPNKAVQAGAKDCQVGSTNEQLQHALSLLYECRDVLALWPKHQPLYESVWKWLQANPIPDEPTEHLVVWGPVVSEATLPDGSTSVTTRLPPEQPAEPNALLPAPDLSEHIYFLHDHIERLQRLAAHLKERMSIEPSALHCRNHESGIHWCANCYEWVGLPPGTVSPERTEVGI